MVTTLRIMKLIHVLKFVLLAIGQIVTLLKEINVSEIVINLELIISVIILYGSVLLFAHLAQVMLIDWHNLVFTIVLLLFI